MDSDLRAARRRDLLRMSVAVAGGMAGGAAVTRDRPAVAAVAQAAPTAPPEDLMREHGVLRRILLIYREAIRRIDGGKPVPKGQLHTASCVVREFIEDYHEHLEEKYVFPRLVRDGELVETVSILLTQHQRGRVLIDGVLGATEAARTPDDESRRDIVASLRAFIRMYEPHAAREDTVVFPAFRDLVPARELLELGEIFEDEERQRFGKAGFTGVVERVAELEKALGIYHLSQVTPRPS